MSAEEYKSNVSRMFEALNHHDLAIYDELFAENCVFHSTPPWPDVVGIKLQKEYMNAFFSAYPDAQFTVDEVLIDGDTVATRWRYEGTHTGETPARKLTPTGKHVVVTACTVHHIENGKVAHEWTYADQSALLEQLGVLPAV